MTSTLAALDEASLVAGLCAGEDRAFDQLVRLHGGWMLRVAKRFLPAEEEARDALQDAFLAVFRNIGRFSGRARLSTWLHRVTVNAALMRLRSRKRRPEQLIDDLLPSFLEDGHCAEPASPWRTPVEDDPVDRRETRELVRRCIDCLPEAYRTVLLLRDIEELDTHETGEMLGMNENTVKTRLHRARQALQALLEPHLAQTRS